MPGNSQVTVSWVPDPGVEYWLLYAPVSSISTTNLPPGHVWVLNVTSPYVVTGLTNGVTYSFTLNGRISGGPGGPGTPSVSAIPRPAGATWTAGAAMGTSEMHGVAYGTASDATVDYVAVGKAGAIYRGIDGINWTSVTSGPVVDLNAALYTLGKFIAVGAANPAGNIFYSTDLATWTPATSATGSNLNALASNGALVVAVGDNGTIRYSGDAINWTAAATVPTTNNLYGVGYFPNGLWIAVGAGGTLLTSTDGINWNSVVSGTSSDLRSVAVRVATVAPVYTFVAVGATGTVATSTDGASWTSQTLSPASDLFATSASAGQFLAVGSAGAAFTSVDGITWVAQNTLTSANLLGLFGSSSLFLAVGQNGTNISSR